MRNLVDLLGLNKEDIFEIFHIADKIQEGKFQDFLYGKSIVLFFSNTSIRTRVTFEKGVYLLGASAQLFKYLHTSSNFSFLSRVSDGNNIGCFKAVLCINPHLQVAAKCQSCICKRFIYCQSIFSLIYFVL